MQSLEGGFPAKTTTSLFVVCENNWTEGYGEPLFAAWTKEDVEAWVKAKNTVSMIESGSEIDYEITQIWIKTPEPLYAFYENGSDPVKRRLVWKWDESRARND